MGVYTEKLAVSGLVRLAVGFSLSCRDQDEGKKCDIQLPLYAVTLSTVHNSHPHSRVSSSESTAASNLSKKTNTVHVPNRYDNTKYIFHSFIRSFVRRPALLSPFPQMLHPPHPKSKSIQSKKETNNKEETRVVRATIYNIIRVARACRCQCR